MIWVTLQAFPGNLVLIISAKNRWFLAISAADFRLFSVRADTLCRFGTAGTGFGPRFLRGNPLFRGSALPLQLGRKHSRCNTEIVWYSFRLHNPGTNPSRMLWTKYIRASVVALLVCLAVGCRRQPEQLTVELPSRDIVADGNSVVRLPIAGVRNAGELKVRVASENGHGSARVIASPPAVEYRAGVMPGEAKLVISGVGAKTAEVTLQVQPVYLDRYGDGTPDFLRLDSANDRQAFRQWFTAIAEHEATVPKLPEEIKDCAALLRFSYREAMRVHDSTWANDFGFGEHAAMADIAKYRYPYTPLGPRLFRTSAGRFTTADLNDGTFAEFADAHTLWMANTHFVTRDVHRAQPGDLFFYRQFEQHSPFHSMIFLGHGEAGAGEDFVVYHTGPDGKWPGEMRRVTVGSLMKHPDARWHPVPGNKNFLGVYRWNVLREAQ